MESSGNYYVRNEESGKLNIFTSKAYYSALSPDQKKLFTSYCLFSRSQNCWISKGRHDSSAYIIGKLAEMGFSDHGKIGKKLPFAEQVKREQEKAEENADRADERSKQANKRSEVLYDQAKGMASKIPFGQPILVGHHSEKSDRNYRAKIENKFIKSLDELEKAEYYAQKSEQAKKTAQGAKYQNPIYLAKKIKECQKNLRTLAHRLEGKYYRHSEPVAISENARLFYEKRVTEEKDKLDFFTGCMLQVNPAYTSEKEGKKNNQKKGNSL